MRKVYLGNTQIAITPEGNQDINTLDEVDVSEKATARISAEERAKIIPENIKKDVTILGKTGTFEGGGGTNDVYKILSLNLEVQNVNE